MRRNAAGTFEGFLELFQLGLSKRFHVREALAAGELRAQADHEDILEFVIARAVKARVGQTLETFRDAPRRGKSWGFLFPRKIQRLLERMAKIERMERGKICQMAGRPHYNHQTWQDGRNVVRYVSAEEVASLQEAIDGYNLFMKLAEQYADQIIRYTRVQRAKALAQNKRLKCKQELPE